MKVYNIHLLLVLAVILALCGCKSEEERAQDDAIEALRSIDVNKVKTEEDVVKVYKAFLNNYETYKSYAFAKDMFSEYRKTLAEQEKAFESTEAWKGFATKYDLPEFDGLIFVYEYVAEGKDNTGIMQRQIDDAKEFLEKPLMFAKRKDRDVIGAWTCYNPTDKSILLIEIGIEGDGYYCTENGKAYKVEKKGNRYYKLGGLLGYYYIIKGDKLRLCNDQEGDYTDTKGYRIFKKDYD